MDLDRRGFVRLVGGGFVAAAVGAGCSGGAMPPGAISAWRGPGEESDLRRWILGYAILAPHSHNLQSWLVDLRVPNEILLRCDRERLLPETDPLSRQIMMSHGTFIEIFDLAARERGHRVDVDLFPEGEFGPDRVDGRPVARIRLSRDPSVAKDPLFASVTKRHTNRNSYDRARAVPDAAWHAMAEAVAPHPVRFGRVAGDRPEVTARHRRIAKDAWKIELATPRTILESYKWLRIGSREIDRHRDGISITDPIVVLLDRLGLFDRTKAPGPEDTATTRQVREFEEKIDSTPAFLWMVTEGNDRVTQVNAGRAWARVQLAAAAHGVALQPLSQALQEYPEQEEPYREIHELVGAVPPPRTVQIWARAGYAEAVPPAPRRGVEAILVHG